MMNFLISYTLYTNTLMENNISDKFYSGTSGLLLPVRNKLFYPEEFKNKSRLCFYSSLMNSIEINSSFYKTPMASTIAKWANDVPYNFRFTFKLSKEITHTKELAFEPTAVHQFMDIIFHAKNNAGCLLVQFPPSVHINHIRQIGLLLHELRNADSGKRWNIAMEFRHSSLYHHSIYRLLDDYDAGIVIQDKPQAPTPMLETPLPFIYLRFHGPGGSYRGSYDHATLYEYAGYIKGWMAEGKTVYTYFNNTMGDAIANLYTLNDFVLGEEE